MAISDEDYANALEHQRAHQVALMKLELEKQREEAKMSLSMATSLGALGQAVGNSLTNTTGSQNTGLGYQALSHNTGAQNTAVGTTLVSTGTGTTWANTLSMTQGIKVLNEKDLKHDAMQAPLSALLDMWQMRWQGEWVSETEFAEDDFWRLALMRLSSANKLEKHHLANSYAPVYRIIE